jgi:hypothetical protein
MKNLFNLLPQKYPIQDLNACEDLTVAQAASRLLLIAAARVRAHVNLVGFVVDRAALGKFSFLYFGFPCQISIPLIALQSSPSIIRAGKIGQ